MERYPDVYTTLSPEFTPMNLGMAYGPMAEILFALLVLVIFWGLPKRHKVAFGSSALVFMGLIFAMPVIAGAFGYVLGILPYALMLALSVFVFYHARKKNKSSEKDIRSSFRNLAFYSALFFVIFPVIQSAGVSYLAHMSNNNFRDSMDDGVMRMMTPGIKHSEQTIDISAETVDFSTVDREIVWYEADSMQDLRDTWRLVTLDLGRIAWNLFGDGPDAQPTDRRVWNVAAVIPERIYADSNHNNFLAVLCEYRDGALDRSNWIMPTRTSLGDRPETAPLHAMCPATFNPDNEPLTPAWKFMRG